MRRTFVACRTFRGKRTKCASLRIFALMFNPRYLLQARHWVINIKIVESGRSGSVEYGDSAGLMQSLVAATPLRSFGLTTRFHGAASILGRLISDGPSWSESRARSFDGKRRRAGLISMRKTDTFTSVNLLLNRSRLQSRPCLISP